MKIDTVVKRVEIYRTSVSKGVKACVLWKAALMRICSESVFMVNGLKSLSFTPSAFVHYILSYLVAQAHLLKREGEEEKICLKGGQYLIWIFIYSKINSFIELNCQNPHSAMISAGLLHIQTTITTDRHS